MTTKFTLPGVDWNALLARHQRNVAALESVNQAAVADARSGIQSMLGEIGGLIDECGAFEAKLRQFERAMVALQAANDGLDAEVDWLPDGFVGAISHKLLSPLTSLCSFSEILADGNELTLQQRASFLDIGIAESTRLSHLIDQIVSWSRLRSGRLDWETADFDIGEPIELAVEATRPLFDLKSVNLEAAVARPGATVRGDRRWLAQAIESLLANAAKYSEPGSGRVTLDLVTADGAARVAVSDNGPGIPAGRHGIIFAQFLEAGDTLETEPQGAGFSLALSKAIVERHNGHIGVESRPGEGATFHVSLPIVP
jgi:signal transduction histidine kinase